MISWKKSTIALLGAAAAMTVLSGCAAGSRSLKKERDSAQTVGEIITREGEPLPGSVIQQRSGDIVVRGVRLQNTQFDFPFSLNTRVEFWVDYFLGRGRQHFAKYLERSELFIPYIQPLLRQNGLPEDLVYLAMIESGFNNHAKSHAKAVGPWQFITATGKRYGLMVNWWVDERRDTHKSTLAAVGYLKDLYTMFGSWELAAASYNAGEAKVARAIQRFGSRDFWVISRQRYLRRETRDYVPKIIAAALIAKNRTQFGFAPPGQPAHTGEVVAGDGELVKVEKSVPGQVDETLGASPSETLASILSEEGVEPADDEFTAKLVPQADGPLARPVPTPHVDRKGTLVGSELVEIEVQSPADLLKVSSAAGLSYQTIKSLNPELLRWCTPPNVGSYRIKVPVDVKEKFLEVYNHQEFPRRVQFLTYKVKEGESLSKIARHFGIRVDPMSDLNRLSPKASLRAGTKVLLPIPHDRSRSLASLDVRDTPVRRKKASPAPGKKRAPSSSKPRKINQQKRQAAQSGPISFGG